MRLRVWAANVWAFGPCAVAWVRFRVWERVLLMLPPSRAFRRSMQAKRDTE